MIFASSDVASLLHRWEVAEYVSEAFVIVGCAGELVADFFTRLPENIRKHIGTWSTIVLILALTVGLKCLIRTNELSGSVIGSLGDKATEADGKAEKAISDSSAAFSHATDALTRAGKAEESLGKAENEAKDARNAASNALTTARNARKEADSFENDIVSAKTQAAEAESHLADALQRAAAAEARVTELNRKLADRVLTDGQVLAIARQLIPFAGQEYEVTAYWDSPESLNIANRIHAALQAARWKYNTEGSKSIMWGGEVGVMIWTHPNADEPTKSAAEALIVALNAEGIEAVARQQNPQNPKSNMININVGAKR